MSKEKWRRSLKLAKDTAKRLSSSSNPFKNKNKKDDLSNDIVQYKGVSIDALQEIYDRLRSGEAAKDVELAVAVVDLSKHVKAGHTLRRTGKGKGVAAYHDGEIAFREDQVRFKTREEWTIEDVCTHFVLPLTQPNRCFFLDLLEPKDVGKPFQGAFLSNAANIASAISWTPCVKRKRMVSSSCGSTCSVPTNHCSRTRMRRWKSARNIGTH